VVHVGYRLGDEYSILYNSVFVYATDRKILN